MLLVRGGSVQGLLLWLDRLGCGVYNYAYYTLGAALNTFFPLYIAALLLSVVTIILALSWIDVAEVASSFRPKTPARIVGVLEADPEGVGEGYQEIRPPVLHQRPGRLSKMRVRTVLEACGTSLGPLLGRWEPVHRLQARLRRLWKLVGPEDEEAGGSDPAMITTRPSKVPTASPAPLVKGVRASVKCGRY